MIHSPWPVINTSGYAQHTQHLINAGRSIGKSRSYGNILNGMSGSALANSMNEVIDGNTIEAVDLFREHGFDESSEVQSPCATYGKKYQRMEFKFKHKTKDINENLLDAFRGVEYFISLFNTSVSNTLNTYITYDVMKQSYLIEDLTFEYNISLSRQIKFKFDIVIHPKLSNTLNRLVFDIKNLYIVSNVIFGSDYDGDATLGNKNGRSYVFDTETISLSGSYGHPAITEPIKVTFNAGMWNDNSIGAHGKTIPIPKKKEKIKPTVYDLFNTFPYLKERLIETMDKNYKNAVINKIYS